MEEIILTKDSSSDELKRYFCAVLELSKNDNEFPVNFDEVWMLVYKDRRSAIHELKDKFLQDVDFQTVRRKVQSSNVAGYAWENKIFLSVSCMEYFIAKRNRDVFEVYRQVFHKVAQTQKIMSPTELMLYSAQHWVEQERINKEIEAKADRANARLDIIELERQKNTEELQREVLSDVAVPEETLRSKVCALMWKYCQATNVDPRDAWHKLYEGLYRRYRISLKGRKKPCDKKLIDTAERTDCLDKLYNLASEMVRSIQAQNKQMVTITIAQ